MGKRLCRFLCGTSDHGLTLKPRSSFDGSMTVTMYGDALLDTGVGYTRLVGQINGVTVVWRPIRQSLSAFSTIETEAQDLVDLMQMAEGLSSLLTSMGLTHDAPQLCCDNKGAIAHTQGEGTWRTKTMVAKMRSIRSHLQAGFITISFIDTTKMLADILTKFLEPNPICDALKSLGVAPTSHGKGSSVVIKEECEAVGNVQCLLSHGRLYEESLRRAHGVCRGGWNICYVSMPCCLFGCGVLVRDRIIYCIGHNVWLLLLALSSLPVVSSCRFFG